MKQVIRQSYHRRQNYTGFKFQLKKTFTRIGQSVHRDSEQSRAGQDIQGQMLQVGKKWGVFHLLWFPREIKAHEDIYRKKPFSVLRSLKAHFCIKYLTHWQNITLLMLFLTKKNVATPRISSLRHCFLLDATHLNEI